MTSSFKRFRALGFRDKAIGQDDAVRTTNIRAKHKREGEAAEKQNRENTSALLELRDIEDELKTLAKLFAIQTKAIAEMIQHYKSADLRDLTVNALPFLEQAADKLVEYTTLANGMIESVRSTREDVRHFLLNGSIYLDTFAYSQSSSTNSCKWSNAKPKSTKSACLVCKQTSQVLNPVQ